MNYACFRWRPLSSSIWSWVMLCPKIYLEVWGKAQRTSTNQDLVAVTVISLTFLPTFPVKRPLFLSLQVKRERLALEQQQQAPRKISRQPGCLILCSIIWWIYCNYIGWYNDVYIYIRIAIDISMIYIYISLWESESLSLSSNHP